MLFALIVACALPVAGPSSASGLGDDPPPPVASIDPTAELESASATQDGLELAFHVHLDQPFTGERSAGLAWSDGSTSEVALSFVDGVAEVSRALPDACGMIEDGSVGVVLRMGERDVELTPELRGMVVRENYATVGHGFTALCGADATRLYLAEPGRYTFTVQAGSAQVLTGTPDEDGNGRYGFGFADWYQVDLPAGAYDLTAETIAGVAF